MNYKIITDSLTEPITVDEVLTALKVDQDQILIDEIAMVEILINAARKYCEERRSEAFITKTIEAVADRFDCEMIVPVGPLQSVVSIKYLDVDDTEYTLDTTYYYVDTYHRIGRIVENQNYRYPSVSLRSCNPIIVRYKAGYGDDSNAVPSNIITAMMTLIRNFWSHREEKISDMLLRVAQWNVDKFLDIDRITVI